MIPYWCLFGYFAFGSLTGKSRSGPDDRFKSVAFLFGFVLLASMLAFRTEVGVDWLAYVRMFERTEYRSLEEIFALRDPGYMLLNWTVKQVGAPFWVLTLLGAIIFARGLHQFSVAQSDPWLSTLVAIPYLVIVVAQGYERQGIAIGIILMGLARILKGDPYWRVLIYFVIAATFHSSAAVAVPLTVLGRYQDRWAQFAVAPAVLYYLYSFTLRDDLAIFVRNYLQAEYQSEGTAIRLALCVIPAIIFVIAKKRLRFIDREQTLWRNFAWASFALLALFFITPSTTAIDRAALYVLPLQCVVFSRLPMLINHQLGGRLIVVAGMSAVLFVWLNFAKHAEFWIPYRTVVPLF